MVDWSHVDDTFSAVVAAAKQAFLPSKSPMATRPGKTFWFRLSVNTGLNMLFSRCWSTKLR